MSYTVPSNKRNIFHLDIFARPELRFASLETISSYFMERGVLDLIEGKESFTRIDKQFISILKDSLNYFNPSFLEDISYGYEGDRQIVAFGAVFFRIFKAAYPGLRNVKLSKNEVVELSLIATGWFMHSDEETENDKDILFAKCLKVYHSQYSAILPNYRLALKDLYDNGSMIVFEAALQLNVKRIVKRNQFLLDELLATEQLFNFLDNPEIFLKLLDSVQNLNDAFTTNAHILLEMIKIGYFYPETMLRPELKDIRISYYSQEYFGDFYSEALYLAIKHFNIPALKFLLNLDYEMFENYLESDSDSDSSSEVQTISQDTFNHLRAIFLSETIAQVLESVLNLFRFTFCGYDINFFMRNFKDRFPSVLRITEYYNRSIEEMFMGSITAPTGLRKKRDRSISPIINEKK